MYSIWTHSKTRIVNSNNIEVFQGALTLGIPYPGRAQCTSLSLAWLEEVCFVMVRLLMQAWASVYNMNIRVSSYPLGQEIQECERAVYDQNDIK